MSGAAEADLVREYREAHPKSRVVGILRYVVNTAARRQRECVVCGWQGPTWCGRWPKTKAAIEAEEAHKAQHLGGAQ